MFSIIKDLKDAYEAYYLNKDTQKAGYHLLSALCGIQFFNAIILLIILFSKG